jgi:hypothetical protein
MFRLFLIIGSVSWECWFVAHYKLSMEQTIQVGLLMGLAYTIGLLER